MRNEILAYFGETHASHLHAEGRLGTWALMRRLDCQNDEEILELGCGTGATLAQLAATFRETRFQGVDQSELMQRKAAARLRFCGLKKRVRIRKMQRSSTLPFESGTFDKVFMESVLAIQEESNLEDLLAEIGRVLKPNGILVMNETIWLESVPSERIAAINALCKSAFGIIQATATYPYVEDWHKLLQGMDFEVTCTEKIDSNTLRPSYPLPYSLLSALFTLSGRLRSLLDPSLRREMKQYRDTMRQMSPKDAQMLEGRIITAAKQNRDHGDFDTRTSRAKLQARTPSSG